MRHRPHPGLRNSIRVVTDELIERMNLHLPNATRTATAAWCAATGRAGGPLGGFLRDPRRRLQWPP